MTKAFLLASAAGVMTTVMTAAPLHAQDISDPVANASVDQTAETVRTDELPPIIVTAQGRQQLLTDVPIAVNVVSGEQLQNSGANDIRELTQVSPSLLVSSTGTEANGSARVRGIGTVGDNPGLESSVAVFVDGVYRSRSGSALGDLGPIDRVEVLRGPQSGLYGSNALAGVVNVITRGGASDGRGQRLDAALEAGSFGSVMARGAATLGRGDTFLTASGVYRSTAGVSTAAIGTEADGDRNATAYLRGGARLGPVFRLAGSLRFVDRRSETDGFDFSGGPLQGLAIDDDSFAEAQDFSGGLALTVTPTASVESVLTAAYTRRETVGGLGAVDTFGEIGDRLKLGGRFTLTFATGDGLAHALTAFTDYERETYRNPFPFGPSQAARQRRSLLGFGAEYRLDLFDALFLKAALRRDDNSRFADATSYSLTGSWVVTPATRLHASYGKGLTNPTFSEQFGFIPGEFVGNPALVPEQTRAFDIGVEQRLGAAGLIDVTYFSSVLRDEITSLFPTVVNDAGESEREGLEVAARIDLGALSLAGSYTHLVARDPDGTREVRRPRHQASLSAAADVGPQKRGTLDLGVIYNGEMLDTDFRGFFINGFVAEKTPLDAYVLVRAAGSWRLTDALVLFGRVENLLDEEYQEVISYGTPGLAAYAGIRLTLP